jgi:predicted dehydrogenase
MTEKIEHISPHSAHPRAGEAPEIRVGLLGYGFMGKAHVNAYKKIPYIFTPPPALPRLMAICGLGEEIVSAAAQRFGFERYYTEWQELVADQDIQVFDDVGSNDIHAQPSIAAAQAGKHVICEKPLARTAAEAREVWQKVEAAGVKNMVGFNYRFVPAIRLAKQLIDEGQLGEIIHFRACYLQDWMASAATPWVWRFNEANAGPAGTLGDLGSHVIDLSRFLVGEPLWVTGMLGRFTREKPLSDGSGMRAVEVPDSFGALMEFKNGAMGVFQASSVATGHDNQEVIEINGTQGSLIFNLEDLNHLQVFLKGREPSIVNGFTDVQVTQPAHPFIKNWWPAGHIIGWEHTFVHEICHFLDAVVNDRPVNPYGATFEDGYKTAVISEAIMESSQTGKRARITY